MSGLSYNTRRSLYCQPHNVPFGTVLLPPLEVAKLGQKDLENKGVEETHNSERKVRMRARSADLCFRSEVHTLL